MTLVHREMHSKTEQFQFKHVCFCKIMDHQSNTTSTHSIYLRWMAASAATWVRFSSDATTWAMIRFGLILRRWRYAVNGWMCWYYTVDSALLVVTQMVCSASPQVQSSILADSRIQILFLEMFRLLCKRLPVDSFLPLLAGTLYPRYGRWGIWHGLSEWGRKAGLPVAEFWWILELFTGRIYDKQFAV